MILMICPHCYKPFFPAGNVYECPNINDKKREKRDIMLYVVCCIECKKVVNIVKW